MGTAFIILLVFAFFILMSSFFTVKQQSSVVIERFGKFQSVRNSGLQLKIPIVDRVAGRVNLKIQQLDVIIETKTKDNVFIKMKVSVFPFFSLNYKIKPRRIKIRFLGLYDTVSSYVYFFRLQLLLLLSLLIQLLLHIQFRCFRL